MQLIIKRDKRKDDEMRPVEIIPHYLPQAEGSCFIKYGNTHLVCTASVERQVPHFLRNSGKGWVTAEYGMLPRSTGTRMQREVSKQRPDGRAIEIQRLIGRSLRAVVDMQLLGERQIIVDCDVISADGGTRTAAITGGFVALHLACQYLVRQRQIKQMPIKQSVAAVSCGIVNGKSKLDLDYLEDSQAEVDANFVMLDNGKLIEVQMTAEQQAFSYEQLGEMHHLASQGIMNLLKLQQQVLNSTRS